jgi:threonine dehydratase
VTAARAAARIVPGGDGATSASASSGAFPTLDDVRAAARRLEAVVQRTALRRSGALSELAGVDVHLKLEGSQRTGSFKLRGAYNVVALLSAEERARGLVTASAGNHGQGVAWAARRMGTRAVVFVPEGAPEGKQRCIARFGAELRRVAGGFDHAHAAAVAFAAESGAVFVSAFSDPAVTAGQGTVALELFDQLPGVRTIVAPVGGGGLIGGIGVVARALGQGVRVVGVQTDETAAMHASLAAGRPTSTHYGPTLCEGLSGDVDERALALARVVVDEVVLVSEDAVRRAIRWLHEEEGVVAEGSAAVGVAALREGAVRGLEGPVAVVLTGSNIDAARLVPILLGD